MSYSYAPQSSDSYKRLIARVRDEINDISGKSEAHVWGEDYFATDEDILNRVLRARYRHSVDVIIASASSGATLTVQPLDGDIPSGAVLRFWTKNASGSNGQSGSAVTVASDASEGDTSISLESSISVAVGAWAVTGSGIARSWDVCVPLAGADILGSLATNQAYVLKKRDTIGDSVDGPAVADSIRKDISRLLAKAARIEGEEDRAAAASGSTYNYGSTSVEIVSTW